MQKILFVSYCILNTAAKVARYGESGKQEEKSGQEFVMKAVEQGIQLVQLPCPEFTLYGPNGGAIQGNSLTIRFSGSIAGKY